MPPTHDTLRAEVSARKSAENRILAVLKNAQKPVQVDDLVNQLNIDQDIVRRAILRIAASGRAVTDAHLNLSLAK
jgi:hypothetical protein